jgi:hypothetical protein
MNDTKSPVYEARYGWDRRTVGVVAVSVFFTAVLLLPDIPLFARILGIPLFAGGAVVMSAAALSRKAALRVDGTGVLLGGSPPRYAATTAHVPWADITAVVLWAQDTAGGALPYVGRAWAPCRDPARGTARRPRRGSSSRTSRSRWPWRRAPRRDGAWTGPVWRPRWRISRRVCRSSTRGEVTASADRHSYGRLGQRHARTTPDRSMPTPLHRA